MSRYVVDSWAWIEYLDGSDLGGKAKGHIEGGNVFTNVVSIAEVASKVSRKGGDVDTAFNSITSLSKIITPDADFAKGVGLLHAAIKQRRANFGLADAFVLYTARRINAKVLTGDPDFKGLKDVELLTK